MKMKTGFWILVFILGGILSGCSKEKEQKEIEENSSNVLYHIKISNSSLENSGNGWKMALGEHWIETGLWSHEAHTGEYSSLIKTDKDNQRCLLYSPIEPLKPGMKIRVSFYAKWLSDDNTVFIGFHQKNATDSGDWNNLWKGSVPQNNEWNKMDAEVEVPAFLENESSIYLRIGLPNRNQSMWKKPYTGFVPSCYLIDDISIAVLGKSEIASPKDIVTHSFDGNDPRDNPSKFGVYWTPWRTWCRTSINSPEDYNRSNQESEQQLDLMKQAGIKWIRSIWRWDKIEWNMMQPDYTFLDYVVEEAWKRDIRFVPCLHTVPRWASTASTGNSEYNCFPPHMEYWDNFVYNIVNHFKHRIKYWETWNEPNYYYWLGTSEDYFELQKTAYLAAKRADPQSKILIGAYAIAGAGHLDQLLQLGAKDYFDLVSIHPYPPKDASVNYNSFLAYQVRTMRMVMAQYGCEDRPIWFTEVRYVTDDKNKEAEMLPLLFEYPFHKTVEKIFWFLFDRWDNGAGGLVRIQADGQIVCNPCYDAYRKASGKE